MVLFSKLPGVEEDDYEDRSERTRPFGVYPGYESWGGMKGKATWAWCIVCGGEGPLIGLIRRCGARRWRQG